MKASGPGGVLRVIDMQVAGTGRIPDAVHAGADLEERQS
jgi:hypothetical protein